MAEKKRPDEEKTETSAPTESKPRRRASGAARSAAAGNGTKEATTSNQKAEGETKSTAAKRTRSAADRSAAKGTAAPSTRQAGDSDVPAAATRKKTASSTAKAKTPTPPAAKDTERNSKTAAASGEKKTAAGTKKAATGAKNTPKKRKTATNAPGPASDRDAPPTDAASAPEWEAPRTEQASEPELPRIEMLPVAIPAGEMIQSGEHEVSDAHPTVDFPEKMRRSFFLRLAFLVAVAAVLVVSAYIYHNRPAVYTEQTSSVNFLYQAAEDRTVILVNGTERGAVSGTVSEKLFSGRGDACAAVIGNTLYIIKGKNVMPIAEAVLDFTLSADGDALAYRTAPANLYYRETGKKDEPSLISKECYSSAYCLSASGRELAYTARDEAGVSRLRIESYSGSRPYIENVAGFSPVAVSDKCRYIYYTDQNGALFIFESKTASKIKCADKPDLTSLIFNRDFTEVLFTENGGTVFYAEGERQQIVGAAATQYLQLLPNRRVASRTLQGGMQYMLSSFYKNYFYHASGTAKQLTYLDQKGNLQEISFVDDVSTVTVTDKGVYFLLTNVVSEENTHCVLWHAPKGKVEPERVDWGVSRYCTNIDGSRVMYTGYEDALYIYRAETGSARLCDSIIAKSLAVTTDDLFCFYREEGVLTVSDNGGELRDLATDVVGFAVDTHALYYFTAPLEDGTFTVYVNYRNERISDLLLEGVTAMQ